MLLELSYSNDDAKFRSQKSNPIPLYALQRQGKDFTKGCSAQVTSGNYQRFFAGFSILAMEPNVIGLIVPITNLQCPTLTMVTGATVITADSRNPVYMDMICHSGFTIVDYGQHLANLYLIPLASIHPS